MMPFQSASAFVACLAMLAAYGRVAGTVRGFLGLGSLVSTVVFAALWLATLAVWGESGAVRDKTASRTAILGALLGTAVALATVFALARFGMGATGDEVLRAVGPHLAVWILPFALAVLWFVRTRAWDGRDVEDRSAWFALALQAVGLIVYLLTRWMDRSDETQLLLVALVIALPALLYARSAAHQRRVRAAGWRTRVSLSLLGAIVSSLPVL
jgi:hypothetical protein